MADLFTFVVSNWDTILALLGALLTLASLVTALTPSPKDDEVVRKLLAFFSFLQPKDSAGTVKAPMRAPAPRVQAPLIEKRPLDISNLDR
jgi:hypothetical protein